MSAPFLGEIKIVAFGFAPRGWAPCNGQLLPIRQYSALFSLLGTSYGGDGQTNFALPNLQGRAPLAAGQGPGLTSIPLGESGGVQTVTLTGPQPTAHNHAIGVVAAEGMLAPVGGARPHNNMPPYLAVNFIIALTGVFPPRD